MLVAMGHVHSYFVKRSMGDSIAMSPKLQNTLLMRVCLSVDLHLGRLLFMQYKIS